MVSGAEGDVEMRYIVLAICCIHIAVLCVRMATSPPPKVWAVQKQVVVKVVAKQVRVR